jgi:hypothetical protein
VVAAGGALLAMLKSNIIYFPPTRKLLILTKEVTSHCLFRVIQTLLEPTIYRTRDNHGKHIRRDVTFKECLLHR